jgi:hypothetical protein
MSELDSPELVQPDNVSDYIKINPVPNRVLFEPAFPVFPVNWTKKVEFEIIVEEDAPAGQYAMGIYYMPISDKETIQEMYWKYLTKFQLSPFSMPNVPWYTIYVRVIEPES